MLKKLVLLVAIYFLLLFSINFLHFMYFNVNVVLYASLFDALIAATVSMPIWLVICRTSKMGFYNIFVHTLLLLMLGYIFAISIPTVIDRSLSFYILEKIRQRGGGVEYKYISDIFVNEYLPEHQLDKVRITEQIESGTIKLKNGCIILTDKGKLITDVSMFYRKFFLPKHRLLMGHYSDDLTDPFRNSPQVDYYKCHD